MVYKKAMAKSVTKEVRALRRKDAEERNAKWAALTPKEQLASLDARGMRAEKQRAKISAQLGVASESPKKTRNVSGAKAPPGAADRLEKAGHDASKIK